MSEGRPLNPLKKIKEILMSRYFVIGFRKIKTAEEYKNKIAGHNHRNRNYKNRINIDTSRSKDNIILQKLKYRTADELIDTANQIITEENENIKKRNEGIDKEQKEKLRRGLKKGSSFAFEILVDCSKIKNWKNENYTEYLKEAEQFFRDRFEGQEVLSSVIHLDESKPHLHLTFSYFNTNLKKWNQREMRDKKLTDLNLILKEFEEKIGAKYGLKKGDNKSTKIQLGIKAGKHFNDKFETYKVKKGLFATEEIKAINLNNVNIALKDFYSEIKKKVIKKIPEIGQIERLKEELIKYKRELEEVEDKIKKEIDDKYKQHITELTEALNNNLEQELMQQINEQDEYIKELKQKIDNMTEAYKQKIEDKNMLIQQLQTKIKELTPTPKNNYKDIGF